MGVFEDFFLGRKSNIVRLELLEFSHPSFSATYRCVRNAINGVTVDLPAPDNLSNVHFSFVPMKIGRDGFDGSMDSGITITFGDLHDIIPAELDRIRTADTWRTMPKVRYWAYRSDNLNEPIIGPLNFEISTLPYTKEGFSATATAPQINVNSTGEIYSLERFPMLRGFL